MVDSNIIRLTCRRTPDEALWPSGIDAIETAPSEGRGARIDAFHHPEFVNDCQGWDPTGYDIGGHAEVTMPAHRWEHWLNEYQIVGPDD